MAHLHKLDILNIIRTTGIVPVFHTEDEQIAKKTVKASYDGGIRAFEFTNRGDGALQVFESLVPFVRSNCPGMALGAGTILDAATAALYLQAGADFIVSPGMVEEVATLCNRRGILYCPGCGTVTEILHALQLGCDIVKIFPAETLGGPAFVKNILAPLPWVLTLCTGAVEPEQENLKAWAASGATAVGMGSKLFSKELIKSDNYKAITDLCSSSIEWFTGRRM